MTKLIVETNNDWTRKKIESTLKIETDLLRKAVKKCKEKLNQFEKKYGDLNRDEFYGDIDDMELIEWEGKMDTLSKLQEKLKSLEEITFEYK
ncbi:hypothetical protein GF337_18170 [candidate division KSB1 bacterium]|nr:hypothetical protein [candidate division KSB1 bacterium]